MRFRPTTSVMLAADIGAAALELAQAGRIALEVSDVFIIPAYRRLIESTAAQADVWMGFASDRANGDVDSLRAAYQDSCDAWARAQII
ncbi:MAG: hypothetical protein V3S07_01585, partial [Micropepsaceae bacterium]